MNASTSPPFFITSPNLLDLGMEISHNQTNVSINKMTPVILFTCGALGNLIALLLMATSPTRERKTTFYKLLACLAITDLLGTCATSPVVIICYFTGMKMHQDSPLCHYFSFMLIFAGFATMSLVCAMAVERYICVCHPYTYQCKMTKSYPKISITVALVVPLFVASLPLVGAGHNVVQFPKTWCFFDSTSDKTSDKIFSFVYASTCLASIVVTVYCNITAMYNVLMIRRRQRLLNAPQTRSVQIPVSLSQRYAELHMVIMLLGVTVIFMTCYGPLVIIILIRRAHIFSTVETQGMYLLAIRFASFNQILDPWVYILVRRELRWKIICVFKTLFSFLSMKRLVKNNCSNTNFTGSVNEDWRTDVRGMNRYYRSNSCQYNNIRRSNDGEMDVTCVSFCFHCLCDPPVHRMPVNSINARMSYHTQGVAGSSESLLKVNNAVGVSNSPHRKCPSDNLPLKVVVSNQPQRQSLYMEGGK